MKQEAAQAIIEEARKHPITATLDARYLKCVRDNCQNGGYRVRLEHRRARRVLVIDSLEQWLSVLQVWQGL